jgi:hypothetical protein
MHLGVNLIRMGKIKLFHVARARKKYAFLLGTALLLCSFSSLHAQEDSSAQHIRSSVPPNKTLPELHSPKRAAAMSAMLPGLGQIYNHKYWKVPVIYGAFAGLGYFFWYEQVQFDLFTASYHKSLAGNTAAIDPSLRRYDAATLLEWKNYFNRYRDLSIIGISLVYVVNILDATVDAHLWHFEQKINDDLSLHIAPGCSPIYGQVLPAPTLHLRFSFR